MAGLGPRVEKVVKYGNATYDEDLFLLLERSGFPEETYHTFSYSPLPDDKGNIGGLLCIVVEDTNRYIAERRLTVLRETAAQIANTRELDQLFAGIGRSVGANLYDLPFSLIYLVDADGSRARLVSHAGIDAAHPAAPGIIQTGVAGQPWPIDEVVARSEQVLINDLAKRFQNLPAGAWRESPHSAVAVPIPHQGQEKPAGVLIAGLNPYRPFNDNYRGFINLLAGQIAAGLADVRAYEEERRARSLGRDQSGQDHLLFKRQPRVSHTADPDVARWRIVDRTAPAKPPTSSERNRTDASQRPAVARSSSTRCSISRESRRAFQASLRADRSGGL